MVKGPEGGGTRSAVCELGAWECVGVQRLARVEEQQPLRVAFE